MGALLRSGFIILLVGLSSMGWSQVDTSTYQAVPDTTSEWGDYKTEEEEEEIIAPLAADTTKINSRSVDQKLLEDLKNDPDFDYRQPPTVAESLWDRFLKWLKDLLAFLYENGLYTDWGRLFIYTACLAVLIIIIMVLLKVDAFRVLFLRAGKGTMSNQLFHENIHEMDFDQLIREAREKNDFRTCVRLLFLYALRLLSDKHYVQWVPGKTNHDYVDELELKELKTGLNELSFYFDYSWYGGFPVSEKLFGRMEGIFTEWKSRMP